MKKILIIVTLSAFISSFFYNNNSSSNNDAKVNQLSGKAYVVDGDTIKINGQKIRLIDIDTPESKQTCYNNQSNKKYMCGQESTDFLTKMIAGKLVECNYEKKDIYNRILGKCFFNSMNVNLEMVKNGMAVIYSFDKADEELIKARNFAKDNRLGIWQGAFEIPKNYRKRNRGVKRK